MTVQPTAHSTPPPAAGTVALQRCDDDMRLLRLEVAELQRSLSVTHKTAPDVVSYDRQIAALKADVLRARNEAEGLGAALETPAECRDRWRVLPGRLPSREELAARVAAIEERLAARKDLAVQAGGAAWLGGAAGMRCGFAYLPGPQICPAEALVAHHLGILCPETVLRVVQQCLPALDSAWPRHLSARPGLYLTTLLACIAGISHPLPVPYLYLQKDTVLEELERLTEGLVDKARASHDPALGLAMGMNEARRQQQQLTRRMMATVSELSLYQARALWGGALGKRNCHEKIQSAWWFLKHSSTLARICSGRCKPAGAQSSGLSQHACV